MRILFNKASKPTVVAKQKTTAVNTIRNPLPEIDNLRRSLIVGLGCSIVGTWKTPSPVNTEGVWPERKVVATKTNNPEISILFVGNSYTFRNDLPGMILQLAKSDVNLPFSISVRSVTVGGASLTDTWKQGDAKRILNSRHWDYVVLQEQSLWATTPAFVNQTFTIANTWRSAIPRNTKILVFETWPRKPNTVWYSSPDQQLKSFESMHDLIILNTKALAEKLDGRVVMVGEKWSKIVRKTNIDLYDSDGSHPNLAGTYLAALVFYRLLTGRSKIIIQWKPDISEYVADQLKSI
jgi:hypothetical protein